MVNYPTKLYRGDPYETCDCGRNMYLRKKLFCQQWRAECEECGRCGPWLIQSNCMSTMVKTVGVAKLKLPHGGSAVSYDPVPKPEDDFDWHGPVHTHSDGWTYWFAGDHKLRKITRVDNEGDTVEHVVRTPEDWPSYSRLNSNPDLRPMQTIELEGAFMRSFYTPKRPSKK